ncbi:hypothetical protein AMK26_10450 [Streptomyces sp. CB03234]|nr:hypothetical protein AMK26_10450 [Streptomyces sp. CB03234]
MARANKAATATDTEAGTPGVPGVLVWVITGVQIIPCYAESGLIGGTVRAVIGPVMAGLLWHLAMGLEIRVARPAALSTGLPALIGRELRERLLSYLGLATRDRTAEQITRDRATARAVRLGARRRLGPWGRARLAAAVSRAQAGTNATQRHRLLQDLAARRTSGELRTMALPSPWVVDLVPEPYPATPLGVTGAQLRAMDPLAAVRQVHAARPGATPAELAALLTEYGVPVSEAQVRVATRAGNPPAAPRAPHPVAAPAERPELAAVPDPLPGADAEVPGSGLHLYLAPMPEVHPEVAAPAPVSAARVDRPRRVHAQVPLPDWARWMTPRPPDHGEQADPPATSHDPTDNPEPLPGDPAGSDPLLDRARKVNAAYLDLHGRPAPVAVLKSMLRIGQDKAQQLRDQLQPDRRTA